MEEEVELEEVQVLEKDLKLPQDNLVLMALEVQSLKDNLLLARTLQLQGL